MRAAQLATFAQRMAVGSLPSPDIELESTEARQLVAEFRTTRDRYRGALAAPVTELAAPPERIATAIFGAAENASADEKHRLAEDLVDLQAFVDLPSEPVRKPQRGESGSPTLSLVAARQAAAIAFVTQDERIVGVANAIRGMWLAIGDARAGLTATATYKEAQMGGILASVVWPVVAVPATLVAIGLGTRDLFMARDRRVRGRLVALRLRRQAHRPLVGRRGQGAAGAPDDFFGHWSVTGDPLAAGGQCRGRRPLRDARTGLTR